MCAIAGFLNLHNRNFIVDPDLLERMQARLAHRGPNGYRIWLNQDQGLGLIHRRLSIMDLSDAGFQPMIDDERQVLVMCNGEIYNHPQLRQELEGAGYRYRSNCDTETILHAYKQWGIECLTRLRGMFALVIFDFRTQELFLVRDRIGIKPLYFSLQGGILSFASEIKALWELPWISKEKNLLGIYHYLTYMVSPAPFTIFQGIYKMPAGYYARVDASKQVHFVEWYTPLQALGHARDYSASGDEAFHVTKIISMLKDSIASHMMSDVPYGVFLSGGIDSSLNVALMSELTPQVKTFNVSCADGPEYSEIGWARKVARRFNTDHHEIIISEKEAFDFFERMVYFQDEPIADCVCIPLYYVSKLLKDAGVTVVQVGEGSDELFCGYMSYVQYLTLYQRYWRSTQKYIPAFAKRGISSFASQFFSDRPNRRDFIANWAAGRHLFWSGAVAFSEEWKRQIIHKSPVAFDPIIEQIYPGFDQSFSSYAVVDYHLKKLFAHSPQADFLTSMIYLELKQRLPELLLMRVDKMTMATGVEGRVPFLDHRFVEYALTIPTELKYKDGQTKYILKKAAEELLPHEIVYRSKIGFAAPTSRWFKEGIYFRPFFENLFHEKSGEWGELIDMKYSMDLFKKNHQSGRDHSLQLWVLQNLIATQV